MDVDADVDRVHGGLGMGAVASAALHPDDQVVTGGGDHAGAVAAQARWNHGDHVGTHGRIHMGIFQDAGLNHGSGPDRTSSPGWNMNLTVPLSSAARSRSSWAAPSSMAVCMSWPQVWAQLR